MKIALITTLPELIENKRIKEEAEKMGHNFSLINLRDFNFEIINGQLKVGNLENSKADIIIVRGIFNAIKSISQVVKDLREKGIPVFDNNFLEQRYSIDKVTDLIKLASQDIPVPDTIYCRDFKDFPKNASKIGFPVVVKSSRMGKGVGVFKIDSEKKLKLLIDDLVSGGKDAKGYIIQKYINYVFDLRILIVGEDIFVMQRIPAKGEFRANFSLGGTVKNFSLDQEGEALALRALHAVGMSVAGVDMLITNDKQKFILEVNHTAGMVGMEKATGKNITKVYLEHAIKNAYTI
jgi:RimK family alpha-L-glutamate ligase